MRWVALSIAIGATFPALGILFMGAVGVYLTQVDYTAVAAPVAALSLPMPVIEPVIGYGTILTGIGVLVGLVGMFYTMQATLKHLSAAHADLKVNQDKIIAKLDKAHDQTMEFSTATHLHDQKLDDHERRLRQAEQRLYLNDQALSFGHTAATRSGAFLQQPKLIEEDNRG